MSTLSQFFLSKTTIANNLPDGRSSIEGGWYICKNNSVAWIVASLNTEVSRTWYCIDDATTTANACTGCTGWFVPTIAQLQNPGFSCKQYWDSFSNGGYWSSTECTDTTARAINISTGGFSPPPPKCNTCCVRAFRCVTY
jgi:hypothetical protein